MSFNKAHDGILLGKQRVQWYSIALASHTNHKAVGQRWGIEASGLRSQAMHYRRAQFLLGHMKVLQPFITPQAAARIRYVGEGLEVHPAAHKAPAYHTGIAMPVCPDVETCCRASSQSRVVSSQIRDVWISALSMAAHPDTLWTLV